DQGEPEPRVGVVARGAESLVRASHVAALQRREALLLRLGHFPLRDDGQAALRVGIVRIGAEDAIGLRGIAAIERYEPCLQAGGMPRALEALADLRVGGMRLLVVAQQRNG